MRITQNAYSKIETGDSTLNVERLYDIAQALDTTVFELLMVDSVKLVPVDPAPQMAVVKRSGFSWFR